MIVELALIIFGIFYIYLFKTIDKHEQAIAELLLLHPELLEGDHEKTLHKK